MEAEPMHAFKATEVSSAVHGSSLQSTILTGVDGKEEEEDGGAAATTLTNCVSLFDDCRVELRGGRVW